MTPEPEEPILAPGESIGFGVCLIIGCEEPASFHTRHAPCSCAHQMVVCGAGHRTLIMTYRPEGHPDGETMHGPR
jgi:hypothetical protein